MVLNTAVSLSSLFSLLIGGKKSEMKCINKYNGPVKTFHTRWKKAAMEERSQEAEDADGARNVSSTNARTEWTWWSRAGPSDRGSIVMAPETEIK